VTATLPHGVDPRRGLARVGGPLALLGPALVAAVAYVDPGNFATNITTGSAYGY
jgi:manganese transport protein